MANVESQLRFSLKEAKGKQKYTIATFLSTMLNSDVEIEKNKETEGENKLMEEKKENNLSIIDDETLVTVPMKIIKEYYYMKGYMDAIEGKKQ